MPFLSCGCPPPKIPPPPYLESYLSGCMTEILATVLHRTTSDILEQPAGQTIDVMYNDPLTQLST